MTAPATGSDLKTRFASAMILAPIVVFLIWWGEWPFLALAWLSAALIFWEWTRLSAVAPLPRCQVVGWLALALALFLFSQGYVAFSFTALILSAGCILLIASDQRRWAAAGLIYAGIPMLAYAGLRSGESGLLALSFVIGLVWATDIFAYFCGRAIGGPKIWSLISPNKTWAGLIGGAIAAMLFAIILAHMIDDAMAPLAFVAAILAVVAQAGDFAESAVKRHFGVKDASHLIPGHGGLMDRIDGLSAAAVVALLIGLWRGGPSNIDGGLLFW